MDNEKHNDEKYDIRLEEFLGSKERVEELKRISKRIFEKSTFRVDDKLFTLDVIKLITEYENRTDINTREKLVCIFQSGMNAQRLLSIDEKIDLAHGADRY